MKLTKIYNDRPYNVIGAILGLFIISFSSYANPGAGIFGSWSIVLGLAVTTFFVTREHANYEVKQNRKGTHYFITMIRKIFATLLAIAIVRPDFSKIWHVQWLIVVVIEINILSLFGLLFNFMYNEIKGNHALYFGSEALLDRIGKKHPYLYYGFLLAVYLITCVTTVYMLHH